MCVNVAVNDVSQLYLQHDFYNMIFKSKYTLYIDSG